MHMGLLVAAVFKHIYVGDLISHHIQVVLSQLFVGGQHKQLAGQIQKEVLCDLGAVLRVNPGKGGVNDERELALALDRKSVV